LPRHSAAPSPVLTFADRDWPAKHPDALKLMKRHPWREGEECMALSTGMTFAEPGIVEQAMKRVQAEISTFGRHKAADFKDLENFPFLEAVIQETLRMYGPVTATIPRRLTEPVEVCGYTLPAGTQVSVHSNFMHYNPELFSEPHLFKPGRFLKGSPEFEEHHPYAHLPFGAGARICIGMKFALEEIKLTLLSILQRYELDLSPGQQPLKLGKGTTMGPADGIFGKIRRVEYE